ncbi:hypothetical protein BJX66DRAFT_95747 [Aspergillus keveii]|uniref:Uncharacterized protein n=1 Tax=Aspergillus keveii TaxID=714993 RepID=A0ABR4FLN9_9EURO
MTFVIFWDDREVVMAIMNNPKTQNLSDRCISIPTTSLPRAGTEGLDHQQDRIIKEGRNIRNHVPRRTISEDNSFPVKKDNTSKPYYINSRQQDPISIDINPGDSESAKGIQDFLFSMERKCSDAASGPICIASEDELCKTWETYSRNPLFRDHSPADTHFLVTCLPLYLIFLRSSHMSTSKVWRQSTMLKMQRLPTIRPLLR